MTLVCASVAQYLPAEACSVVSFPSMCSWVRWSTKVLVENDFGGALGEDELGVLELHDRLSEGLTLLRIGHCFAHGSLGGRRSRHGDRHAFLWQLLHELDESAAFDSAEDVVDGHAHVFEEQFAGVLAALADLVEYATTGETGKVGHLGDDEGDALGAGFLACAGDDDEDVAVCPVGDEGLRAVDDVLVAIAHGLRLHALQVGSGAGFGHGDCGDQFAGGHAGQPPLLLLLGAEGVDVVGDDRGVDAVAPGRIAGEPLFLHDDRLMGEGAAASAVFFGDGDAQQSGIAGPVPQFTVDLVVVDEGVLVGHDLLVHEVAHEFAQVICFLCLPGTAVSVENHECSPLKSVYPRVIQAPAEAAATGSKGRS